MNRETWQRAQALCFEASDLPDDQRSAFLDEQCADDHSLRRQVEALLHATRSTLAALDRSESSSGGPDASPPELLAAGVRLGPWRIGTLVGRGGMGEVYEAQRADGAFELRAAVKLLKRGLDTDAIVRRFLRERRILAQLSHPNISHLLDAGVAPDDGRPYLVMEFVEGMSIAQHAAQRGLPVADVLRLMATVCEAVQVAHARNIVHRDLKPSNVLVTPEGQVKLLDFGIAKLLDEDGGEETRMGGVTPYTPEYAAPEQILGADATPASDVYALGVILSELLTERLPHARRGRSATEIALQLSRETIERPSAILRRERGRLPEPLRLARIKAISRDLDLIALKALQVDPVRRYATARELGDDLQRLHDHQPIRARPDSAAYRLGRFVRRNRLAVAAAAALSIGLAAALWQASVAVAARNDAERRQQAAEDLLQFMLVDLREKLQPIGKIAILDAVGNKAMGYFAGLDPTDLTDRALASRATALRQIGELRTQRGDMKGALAAYDEAIELDRQLAARHPADSDAIYNVGRSEWGEGDAHYKMGEHDEARLWYERFLATARRLVSVDPGNPRSIFLLAKAEENRGGIAHLDGDPERARALLWSSRAALEKLLEGSPDREDYQKELAIVHGELLPVEGDQGNWQEALDHATRQRSLLRRLADREPGNAEWCYELTRADAQLLWVQRHLSALDPASPVLEEALQLTDDLVRLEKDNIEYARIRSHVLHWLMRAQLQREAWDAASGTGRRQFEEARSNFERAGGAFEVVEGLLSAITDVARLELLRGNLDDARKILADPMLRSLSDAQRSNSHVFFWLDLHVVEWWIARGTSSEGAAQAAATAAVRRAEAEHYPMDSILMFQYEALRGDQTAAKARLARLTDAERLEPMVRKACRDLRMCDERAAEGDRQVILMASR